MPAIWSFLTIGKLLHHKFKYWSQQITVSKSSIIMHLSITRQKVYFIKKLLSSVWTPVLQNWGRWVWTILFIWHLSCLCFLTTSWTSILYSSRILCDAFINCSNGLSHLHLFSRNVVRSALSLAACRESTLILLCPRLMEGHQSMSDFFITYAGSPTNTY